MLNELIEKANAVYLENFSPEIYFERAIFLSWYCDVGDCTFCYMSTQKDIKNPKIAKRQVYSLYAEALISKHMNWKIGFISGGYGMYDFDKVVEIVKNVHDITGEKQNLNIGILPKNQLEKFRPYISGITGSVETTNRQLHDKVCPSKKLEPIEKMYAYCDGYKRIMTFIVGLGENISDFDSLKSFIINNKIDKIVLYALNPIKGTVFTKGPEPDYYLEWLARTRIAFPKIEIVAGVWTSRINYLSKILRCGPNAITKMPAWKVVGSKKAEEMEEQFKIAERKFMSRFDSFPDVDWGKEVENLGFDQGTSREILERIYKYTN